MFVCLVGLVLMGCSKPIDTLLPLKRMAIVSVTYDPNIYYFHPHSGIDSDRMYAPFSGDPSQSQIHEMMLNEFLIDVHHAMNISHAVFGFVVGVLQATWLNLPMFRRYQCLCLYQNVLVQALNIRIFNDSHNQNHIKK